MRTVTYDVPPQEILTRDSVTIHVDAIMYYKVGQVKSKPLSQKTPKQRVTKSQKKKKLLET